MTGWPGRQAFEVDTIQPLGRTPLGRTALSAWTTGAKRVLVILLNFTNDSSFTSTTVTNAQSLYFGAGSSVARYYAEASYGLATMTGDVVLVTATVAKPTTCDTATIQSQANARALAAGYNYANYQFPVWIFPSISACGWNGLGYVGGGGNWINGSGSMSLLVAAHELGHNFGVLHAHSYDCGTLTIAPSGCTRSEYGDRFDVMGNSRAGHFNAQFKDTFGWLPAGTVRRCTPADPRRTRSAPSRRPARRLRRQNPDDRNDSLRTYWSSGGIGPASTRESRRRSRTAPSSGSRRAAWAERTSST